VANFQCFLFLSSAPTISGLFYCLCLSYSVFYSSKNPHLTNLQLFLTARELVPYCAVPLLLSRRKWLCHPDTIHHIISRYVYTVVCHERVRKLATSLVSFLRTCGKNR
jgi:hypothetical protein